MGLKVRWRIGASVAGILLAVTAAAACSNNTGPTPGPDASPGPGPSSACTPTLQLSQSTVDLAATEIQLTVTTGATCQWGIGVPVWMWADRQVGGSGTFANYASAGSGSGSGTGSVTLALLVASATSARQGEIHVMGSSVRVYQEASCSYAASPVSLRFDGVGGTRSVSLTTSPACAWSFDAPPWITVTPSSGTGSATLMIGVSPTGAPRAALVSTAGRSIGVHQTPAGMSPLFGFSQIFCQALRPGEVKPGLCWFFAEPSTNPASTDVTMVADMRALGGAEDNGLLRQSSTNGLGFSIDWRLSSTMVPGLKAIPVTARDAQGRTATATAIISVMPPK